MRLTSLCRLLNVSSGLAVIPTQERDASIVPYRVIADHIRAAVFLIGDGVLPGAKGRAAIPRIVIRRAVRFRQQNRL